MLLVEAIPNYSVSNLYSVLGILPTFDLFVLSIYLFLGGIL